jgi:hypothetical protein
MEDYENFEYIQPSKSSLIPLARKEKLLWRPKAYPRQVIYKTTLVSSRFSHHYLCNSITSIGTI